MRIVAQKKAFVKCRFTDETQISSKSRKMFHKVSVKIKVMQVLSGRNDKVFISINFYRIFSFTKIILKS